MAYESSVLRRATQRLETIRRQQQEALEHRRRDIYRSIPRIAEIDRLLRHTIVDIISSSLRTGSDPVPAIEVVRDQNLGLQKERKQLLLAHGYPTDALDLTPVCKACEDRGWQGSRMCRCLKQLCAEEQVVTLSNTLNLGAQSFGTFSPDYYSSAPWPGEALSPRANAEFICEICLSYAQKFGAFSFKNLLLSGTPGLGKTFLSACIARSVAEQGFSVVYDTAINILAQFEGEKFARSGEDAQAARGETRRYLNCDLLILDDLGSELSTPFTHAALYRLINSRLLSNRRTVISTNLSMEDIRTRYTSQIASRLEGEYRVLPLYGEDIRLLRKKQLL